MATHQELKARAATTYNAAADWYDAPENTFWARFGRRTVDLVHLRPGMCVLDVCSGSGASAVPAAQAVGSSGRVVAVDISDDLLAPDIDSLALTFKCDHPVSPLPRESSP